MEEKFIEQLKEVFELDGEEIDLNDSFRDYENWDSMTNLSLIAMIDSEFGVNINSEEFNKLETVQDLFEAIKNKMQ